MHIREWSAFDWKTLPFLIIDRCTVVRFMQESTGKWEIRRPLKSQPLKISVQKFANVITSGTATIVHCANFGKNRFSGRFSPSRWIITPLWHFWLSCPVMHCPVFFSRARAQVEPLGRFSRFMAQTTCFCARKCLLGVTTIDGVIWGNMPKTS